MGFYKVSIDNINRMTNATDKYEKEILNHGFFSHFYRQSRFTIIVQLCKIFAKTNNQKRNLYKLFNRLASDKYDGNIEAKLKKNLDIGRLFTNRKDIQNEIISLTAEIETHNELIDRVVMLRDKYYAHSDPDSDLPKVTNNELKILVDLAVKIYNKIRGRLYDISFMFDQNSDWRVDYPISVLAAQRKDYLEKLNQKNI